MGAGKDKKSAEYDDHVLTQKSFPNRAGIVLCHTCRTSSLPHRSVPVLRTTQPFTGGTEVATVQLTNPTHQLMRKPVRDYFLLPLTAWKQSWYFEYF